MKSSKGTVEVSFLTARDEAIPGIWISYCPDLNIYSQGTSSKRALKAVKSVVKQALDCSRLRYMTAKRIVFSLPCFPMHTHSIYREKNDDED